MSNHKMKLLSYSLHINRSIPTEGQRVIEEKAEDHLVLHCHSQSLGVVAINSYSVPSDDFFYQYVVEVMAYPYRSWDEVGA